MSIQRALAWVLVSITFAATASVQPEVLFSPDDRPAQRLVTLLDQAKTKIHAAVYMITEDNITQALIEAHRRGVDVQVVVDQLSMDGQNSKGAELQQAGVPLYVFKPKAAKKRKKSSALMHHKFALIDDRTWTGSFNWTHSANTINQENAIILSDPTVAARFAYQFGKLKHRCTTCLQADTKAPRPKPATLWQTTKEFFSDLWCKVSN